MTGADNVPGQASDVGSFARLRRSGKTIFLLVLVLLGLHIVLIDAVDRLEYRAVKLASEADSQAALLDDIGRQIQGVLVLRERGVTNRGLQGAQQTALDVGIRHLRARETAMAGLIESLQNPFLAFREPDIARSTYDRVLETFLRRSSDLVADSGMQAISSWMLPDLAVAPRGILMERLAAIKTSALRFNAEWRRIGLRISLASAALTTVLTAVLVYAFFVPLVGRAEADYRELQSALSVRTRYFYQMSHELRTPLNAINGYSELMLHNAERDGDSRAAGFTRAVIEASQQLTIRIEDILLLGALQAGHYRNVPVTFDPLAAARAAATRVAVDVTFNDRRAGGAEVHMDRDALVTMVAHLLRNARRHAGERVEINLADLDGSVILEVIDDGPGLDPAEVERILKPFHTTGNLVQETDTGLGVGLAIVHRLAEENGVAIAFSTADPAGLVVRLHLPTTRSPGSAR
ncbi:MAG: HAMP domain-containing sensor histidine kinase [Pseudomonadota bacterium]|nr:HAMP domain-containing sensor histidine kinase [Pseudomonadota bacterium]